MEKAMLSAHGIGYETYKREHDIRMNVEMKREENYKKGQQLFADLESKLHSNI
ncbi:hypothetical protein [Jeotgalibacillus marinus]|uniref:Uncharacterized protein n=1 Tax=Jeotgalibacillus marinus TaxID=86667 RepID=A0ABV3Q3R6_9BACL